MNCSACGTVMPAFETLTKIGRTKGVEVRACACGAPVARPVVRKPRTVARLITASSSRCFRACPRKYLHSYVTGLRSIKESDALRFGTLWHLIMEAWWQRREWAAGVADAFDLAKARALLAGYSARWNLDGFEVLAIEQPFSAPLVDGSGHKVRGWRIAGKVDGIVRQDGRTLLLEHKTSSEDVTPGGDYWARLTIDGQVSIYHDGAAALGHQVEGCLYDVVRKPALRPGGPVALLDETGEKIVLDAQGQRVKTKTGSWRQTGDAAQGYVTQTRPETPEEYEARCLASIAERPNETYARAEVVRLDGELSAARDDLAQTVRMIEWATKRSAWPRNDSACFEYGRCQYWGLCAGQASESEFRRIENLHPELEAA